MERFSKDHCGISVSIRKNVNEKMSMEDVMVGLPSLQGMWRGPRGFLAGVVNGSVSLVSHVTAGTVTR